MSDLKILADAYIESVPKYKDLTLDAWTEKYVKPIGGEVKNYSFERTPYFREILKTIGNHAIRRVIILAPAQTGKSLLGHAFGLYTIANGLNGHMAFYFETDPKAIGEYKTKIYPEIEACKPVRDVLPMGDRNDDNVGQIITPSGNTIFCFGATNPKNRTSKTLRYVICDEVHDWPPGALSDVKNRTAGIRLHKVIVTSTGSKKKDQLHQEWELSTQKTYQWKCPSCGEYHTPEFNLVKGGLQYKIILNDKKMFDYNKTSETIRYVFPCCEHSIKDDVNLRQKLNENGRFSPAIDGSNEEVQGFRISGPVPINQKWADVVQKKNVAMLALRNGDKKELEQFVKEVEADFWDVESEKNEIIEKPIIPNVLAKKGREGLIGEVLRCAGIDYQQGSAGELPHFWMVIVSYRVGASLPIFEGKVQTENDLVKILNEYGCDMSYVAIDSQFSPDFIYSLCAKYGWTALRSGAKTQWEISYKDTIYKKFYSELMSNEFNDGNEIRTYNYMLHSSPAIRDRLDFMRSSPSFDFQIPSDISGEYVSHMTCEKRVAQIVPKTGETIYFWKKTRKRNDLYVCTAYTLILWDFYATFINSDLLAKTEINIANPSVDEGIYTELASLT